MCFAHMSTSGSRPYTQLSVDSFILINFPLKKQVKLASRQSRDGSDPLTIHAFIWGDWDLLCYRDNWQESKVIVNSAGGQLPRRIHWCLPLVQSEENKQEPLQMIIVPLTLHSITYILPSALHYSDEAHTWVVKNQWNEWNIGMAYWNDLWPQSSTQTPLN